MRRAACCQDTPVTRAASCKHVCCPVRSMFFLMSNVQCGLAPLGVGRPSAGLSSPTCLLHRRSCTGEQSKLKGASGAWFCTVRGSPGPCGLQCMSNLGVAFCGRANSAARALKRAARDALASNCGDGTWSLPGGPWFPRKPCTVSRPGHCHTSYLDKRSFGVIHRGTEAGLWLSREHLDDSLSHYRARTAL